MSVGQSRRSAIIVIVSALVVSLTACAGLPQRGAVNVVPQQSISSNNVVLDAKGPAAGASPEELVQGFLLASSVGVSDDYQVARQFLTPEAAARWNPSAGVKVYSDTDAVEYSQAATGAVVASVPIYGSLDQNGCFTLSSSEAMVSQEFSLMVGEDGEWRIAVLDDSVMMAQTVFSSLYMRAPLYFLNASHTAFVPEERWYPRFHALTMMSADLLEGPSPWLSKIAHTSFSGEFEQTDLDVQVVDSIAEVNLPKSFMGMEPEELAELKAQFTQTLVSSGLVQSVRLLIQGADVNVPDNHTISVYPYEDSPLIAVRDGALVSVQGSKQTDLIELNEQQRAKFDTIAVPYGVPVAQVVGLSDSGTQITRMDVASGKSDVLITAETNSYNGSTPEDTPSGNSDSKSSGNSEPASRNSKQSTARLAAPSVDAHGWVWTAQVGQPGTLAAINLHTGERVQLPVPHLVEGTVTKVLVSREGARIVVLCERNETSQLMAYGVERSEDGAPTGVGEPLFFGQEFARVVDAAWVNELELAVIAVVGDDGRNSVFTVSLGGQSSEIMGVLGAVRVTAGRGVNSLVVLDSSGSVLKYSGSAWDAVAENAQAIAFPG